ncbi:leucine--tRNA ligase [Frigoriflavimonas asaccharolytica]|uniref:Leucine--tRNA ligase n=1 Tax=Frigoriflavimonas asaccharolytica TaxID=2735899 RepID=A0A8J8K9C0_9FLAO|nr:leucine--tRNA ligase [Frigoriflavimonas asaccharolytica]NRS93451.1 leucyl-tRNA synthetase [Frigoriflavimonas asaccharolytica]
MFYDHKAIDERWQKFWKENQTFKTSDDTKLPKYYVLDMFPYPSGAGLHVGHPLGYIASDIYARYKRHQGFNVLHPIGYDSFGLPAEQYAIQTGQHPAETTKVNIEGGVDKSGNKIDGYKKQLDKIGFSFDWTREVRTSEPNFYKWTQWIFIELFHSWYNKTSDKAENIQTLIAHLENHGTENLEANQTESLIFSAEDWKNSSEAEQQLLLLNYRLAYRAETTVNWCPGLGTVLANDEVKDGKSERGGFPVFQKKMMQWSMRISAYSERLLQGLENIDWPQPLKDSQKYWIGKSIGAEVSFKVKESEVAISVFTTRPDTIFGATFMVLAPESPLVANLTTAEQKSEVENYIEETSKKTERDRMADVKSVSGAFTGSFAINPFTNKEIPIYISDYVLMGYGTGAVMAVPAHDERDHRFAKKFGIEILQVVEADVDVQEASFDSKDSVCINSEFLNGLNYEDAKSKIISEIEKKGIGEGTINYRQRDAIFSRQRYWGEPVPVYYKDEVPYTLPISTLPLELPEVEKYLPTEDGNPPLGNAKEFAWDEENQKIVSTDLIDNKIVFPIELSTMPGWAGSSWYFLRYMDPQNENGFVSKQKADYWGQVDLYIGGSEHATGHLLYARFWNKFLKDRGFIEQDEPFKKLINQGMILGMSAFVYRIEGTNQYISKGLIEGHNTQKVHVDVSLLKGTTDELDIEKFKNWRLEYADAEFILEDDKYICEREVEKMSKSKYNVVNPDEICEEYGADCLRLYEMFLGPLEQSKPWNTQGLSGVYGFLKKFYNLYYIEDTFSVSEEEPTKAEFKILHTLIKKFETDIQNFSFNTSVSSFMIAANDLQKLKCNKRAILEPLAVVISPYAPHICEELWRALGHETSIEFEKLPELVESYLIEDEIEYPVSFNGKMKFKLLLSSDLGKEEVEKIAMQDERVLNFLNGNVPTKIIIVPKKIINIVM